MKKSKFGLYLTGFIFCISLTLLFLISNYDSQDNGRYILSLGHKNFTADDIMQMEETDYYFTYENTYQEQVSTKLKEESAIIVETNENYASLKEEEIVSGTFFNAQQVEKGYRVAVLSTVAAWDFFGTEHCVGNHLVINKNDYEVVGVLKNAQEQGKEVYIPVRDKTNAIKQLTVKLDNRAQIQPLINTLGYAEKDIEVTDFNNVKDRISQRPKVIIFLWGLYFIKRIVSRSIIRLKTMWQMIKEFLTDNYMSDIGAQLLSNPLFLRDIVGTALNMILVCLIFVCTKFKPTLPSNFFAVKAFDIQVFIQMLYFFVSVDDVPTYIKDINMLSNLFFVISIVSSICFMSFIKKSIKEHNLQFNLIDIMKRSQYTKGNEQQ